MPRFHSVSHYHSQLPPKQSSSAHSTMSTMPRHSRHSSASKIRSTTPVLPHPPPPPSWAPVDSSCTTISSSASVPHSSRSKSTRPSSRLASKRLSKSLNHDHQPSPISKIASSSKSTPTTLAHQPASNSTQSIPKSNRPSASQRPRKTTRSQQRASSTPLLQSVSKSYNLSIPDDHHPTGENENDGGNHHYHPHFGSSTLDSSIRASSPTTPPPHFSSSPVLSKPQVSMLATLSDGLTVKDQNYQSTQAIISSKHNRSKNNKPITRKSKKGSQRRASLIYPQSSDCEDLLIFDHPIYSFNEYPSRSATPSPLKIAESNSAHDKSQLSFFDDSSLVQSSARKSTSALASSSTTLPLVSHSVTPTRQHARAKSVASIFDVGKPSSAVKQTSQAAKDDWDMPIVSPPRALTWQQKEKAPAKSVVSQGSNSRLAQKLAQHDLNVFSGSKLPPSTPKNTKEISVRSQRSPLARTLSASTLTRPTDSAGLPDICRVSSRSDDESGMTWQQSILRPSSKAAPSSSRADISGHPSIAKASHKKNAVVVTHNGFKTPVKPSGGSRKPESLTNPKPKPALAPTTKRRNSVASARLCNGKASEVTCIPEWKPFSSNLEQFHPILPPLSTQPMPITGAQNDHSPLARRHVKSYTHQPATMSNRSNPQASFTPASSAPTYSNIPDSNEFPYKTPSKSRSSSEDLNLITPGNKFTSSALRAAFMYAGPQFHNSPCPAALPAPKFSFATA